QMIVQVGADARLVERHRNAELRQLRSRPYAGKHHDVRRADGAGREDHLAAATSTAHFAVLPPVHTGRALAIQFQSLNQTAGCELEVFTMQHRLEKSARRRPSAAPLLVDVKITDALVVAGVEILDGRDAVLV